MLFPFVVLAILMAMAGGISEHMLTSWSSLKGLTLEKNEHNHTKYRKYGNNKFSGPD